MQSIHPNTKFTAFEAVEEVKQSRGFSGISTSDVKAKVFRAFKDAPPWRYISEGLNLEAECKSNKCDANKKLVWIQKGFGEFDIMDIVFNRTLCPICQQETEDVANFGFLNCDYKIVGNQINPERKKVDIAENAPKDGVTTFEPGEANWVSMTITTKKCD